MIKCICENFQEFTKFPNCLILLYRNELIIITPQICHHLTKFLVNSKRNFRTILQPNPLNADIRHPPLMLWCCPTFHPALATHAHIPASWYDALPIKLGLNNKQQQLLTIIIHRRNLFKVVNFSKKKTLLVDLMVSPETSYLYFLKKWNVFVPVFKCICLKCHCGPISDGPSGDRWLMVDGCARNLV